MDLSIFLQNHPLVLKTHYPGLETHPQHFVAKKQMRNGFGGMLSFEVADERMAMAVAGAVSLIKRATSLGGTETLIEHRASIEPVGRVKSPLALLRLSVGLENVADLKNDLDVALEIAKEVVTK
jgi:cystathionine gamma-synthase